MNCIELSINDIRAQCSAWADEINKEFQPQLLIYVAKAGYLIAEAMNTVFHADILGIDASRKGNKLKEKLGGLFSHIPRFLHKWLIALEMKVNVHGKDIERHVQFHEKVDSLEKDAITKVLVIDDSVDTGHSLKTVLEEIKKIFLKAEVRTAALNVWEKSRAVVTTDYSLYLDTIIKAPMSKDSKEYKTFRSIYNAATKCGRI